LAIDKPGDDDIDIFRVAENAPVVGVGQKRINDNPLVVSAERKARRIRREIGVEVFPRIFFDRGVERAIGTTSDKPICGNPREKSRPSFSLLDGSVWFASFTIASLISAAASAAVFKLPWPAVNQAVASPV